MQNKKNTKKKEKNKKQKQKKENLTQSSKVYKWKKKQEVVK